MEVPNEIGLFHGFHGRLNGGLDEPKPVMGRLHETGSGGDDEERLKKPPIVNGPRLVKNDVAKVKNVKPNN